MASKTGGRKKGQGNVISGMAKENIAAVFVRLGGTAAMARWAKKNQTEFYRLYGRLLPHEVVGDKDNPLTISVIERVIVEPRS